MPVEARKHDIGPSVDARLPSERDLVQGCLNGCEDAWTTLVERYKNLVFSIPLKCGLPREDAADIFQAVFLELVQQLPKLRESKALQKWLMQVTWHKCCHSKQRNGRIAWHDDVANAWLPKVSR